MTVRDRTGGTLSDVSGSVSGAGSSDVLVTGMTKGQLKKAAEQQDASE